MKAIIKSILMHKDVIIVLLPIFDWIHKVGLAFDHFDVLWGVENSADRLQRNDIGGDIHNQNPAEELNRFLEEDKGKHWGYPYCWTEFDLARYRRFGAKPKGRGTPWAWPSFKNNGKPNDAWCLNNTITPMVSLQAHSAPLGITFCKWYHLNIDLAKGKYFTFMLPV